MLFRSVLCTAVAIGTFALPGKYAGRDLTMTVPDVFVSSEPRGATLRIGDNQVGITPWAGSNVWTGEVTWELTAAGYQKIRGTFKGGEPVKLNVKLQKK